MLWWVLPVSYTHLVAATGATVTNAAGDTTKVEATGTTVADAAGNKATFTKDGVTISKPGKDTVSLTDNCLLYTSRCV